MYKVSRILPVALLCTTLAFAQNKQDVPAAATAAFKRQYPAATRVKWEQEHGKYEVSFRQGNNKMSVLYSATGIAEETETTITVAALPAPALTYARAKGKIKEAALIVLANGSTIYEAEVNGKDLIFDDKGNFKEERSDD